MPDLPKRRRPWFERGGSVRSADGTPVVYAMGGPTRNDPSEASGPALLCCNGLGVSTFFWDYLAEHFTPHHPVVVWDYRGHGASGRPERPETLSIPGLADDLARIMDATGLERAVLLGHSLGCQVIFEAWNRHRARVLGLVPVLGSFGRPADTLLDPRVGQLVYRVVYGLGTRAPDLVQQVLRNTLRRRWTKRMVRWSGWVHGDLCPEEAMDPYMEHMSRQDMYVFAELLRAAQEHDAGPYLDRIDVPTLVVAGERDVFTPRHLSIQMATRIPNAEFLEIPRGSHAALVEQPELINLRLEKFLRQRVPAMPSPGGPPAGKGPQAA